MKKMTTIIGIIGITGIGLIGNTYKFMQIYIC